MHGRERFEIFTLPIPRRGYFFTATQRPTAGGYHGRYQLPRWSRARSPSIFHRVLLTIVRDYNSIVDKSDITVKSRGFGECTYPTANGHLPSDGVIARRLVPVAAGTGREFSHFESDQNVYPMPPGRVQFQTAAQGRGPDSPTAGQHTAAVHKKHGFGADASRTSGMCLKIIKPIIK